MPLISGNQPKASRSARASQSSLVLDDGVDLLFGAAGRRTRASGPIPGPGRRTSCRARCPADERRPGRRRSGTGGLSAPPVRLGPMAAAAGLLRVAVAPALGVAAGAGVGAAGEVEVEQRLAERLVLAVGRRPSRPPRCDLGLVGRRSAGSPDGLAERLVLGAPLLRELDALQVGDRGCRSAGRSWGRRRRRPRRHRRVRPAVHEDVADLVLAEAVHHRVERRGRQLTALTSPVVGSVIV